MKEHIIQLAKETEWKDLSRDDRKVIMDDISESEYTKLREQLLEFSTLHEAPKAMKPNLQHNTSSYTWMKQMAGAVAMLVIGIIIGLGTGGETKTELRDNLVYVFDTIYKNTIDTVIEYKYDTVTEIKEREKIVYQKEYITHYIQSGDDDENEFMIPAVDVHVELPKNRRNNRKNSTPIKANEVYSDALSSIRD